MKEFTGKTAVITGGAHGIGRAMGELFLSQGMQVVLADIEQEVLDATVAELNNAGGGRCIGVVTDVSKADDVQHLADAAIEAFGAIHIACNNAGVFAGGLLWEESLADFNWQLDVNVWGVIHGIRTFVPIMAAQGDACGLETRSRRADSAACLPQQPQ